MKQLYSLIELDNTIKHLKSFIYDIEICISNIDEIITAQQEGLFLKPIEDFIGHYVFLCYSTVAINCYKIFGKNENHSFIKLFNKLKEFKYDAALNGLLTANSEQIDDENLIKSKERLLEVVAKLRSEIEQKKPLITKINNRRSKFYAHSDKNANDLKPETLNDLKELRDFAISMFHKVNEGLHGNHFMFKINVASIAPVLQDRKLLDEQYQKIERELD